jgi:DNA mismatch repair protein MutS
MKTKLTPMMKQYQQMKAKYPHAILFYRMGDFYEMFGEDAKLASRILGITLTSRDKDKTTGMPMAGVPHHAADGYIQKLLAAGHRVAICDQVEEPTKGKALVDREIVRVVTPGTATSESYLVGGENAYLAALRPEDGRYGLAYADLLTGEFRLTELDDARLVSEVGRISPKEILVPESWADSGAASGLRQRLENVVFTTREDWTFAFDRGRQRLLEHFGVPSLDGYGCADMALAVGAAGVLIDFLKDTQKAALPHLVELAVYSITDFMILDLFAQRNLELVVPLSHGEPTLLGVLDCCASPMGSRTLRRWLLAPLLDLELIRERQDSVTALVGDADLRRSLEDILSGLGDLERTVGRVGVGQAGPRDLLRLGGGLEALADAKAAVQGRDATSLHGFAARIGDFSALEDSLRQALRDDAPTHVRDGGVIREGYSAELDELRNAAREGRKWIAALRDRERGRTGISSLKVGFNKVFGYYIEVTRPHLSKVPSDYIRKQTLANAERFYTPDLKEREAAILGAQERSVKLEATLFASLRDEVAGHAAELLTAARAAAELDALVSLGRVAAERGYVRPEVASHDAILIRDGRHPVLDHLLPVGEFVPNDTELDCARRQILLVTGPNMAGKSTYLRQVALIVIMAQMGSFVPASEVTIGAVDRVFTRVGALDRLARGQSTFMVEMTETANVLRNATGRSLVLLDEVGRGTSTYDGLSIAWAVLEYLHESLKATPKTLFATHYHELTQLDELLPRVVNVNLSARTEGGHVVFLRKVVPGGASHSYGIDVAALAGLPRSVVRRAREVLKNLEGGQYDDRHRPALAAGDGGGTRQLQIPMPLEDHPVVRELRELQVEGYTPLEALVKLDDLRRKATEPGNA